MVDVELLPVSSYTSPNTMKVKGRFAIDHRNVRNVEIPIGWNLVRRGNAAGNYVARRVGSWRGSSANPRAEEL